MPLRRAIAIGARDIGGERFACIAGLLAVVVRKSVRRDFLLGSVRDVRDQAWSVVQRIVVFVSPIGSAYASSRILVLRANGRRELFAFAGGFREKKTDGCPGGGDVELFEQIEHLRNRLRERPANSRDKGRRPRACRARPSGVQNRATSQERQMAECLAWRHLRDREQSKLQRRVER